VVASGFDVQPFVLLGIRHLGRVRFLELGYHFSATQYCPLVLPPSFLDSCLPCKRMAGCLRNPLLENFSWDKEACLDFFHVVILPPSPPGGMSAAREVGACPPVVHVNYLPKKASGR
jgi:hypothetical protein